MSIKRALPLLLLLLAPVPTMAGTLYSMECGSLRRENHSLSPSPLQNPLRVQWVTPQCQNLGDPISNPVILSDRVVQSFFSGVRCFDRATGARLWTWTCDNRTQIWNSPCYDGGRNRLYVGCFNGDTLALDAQTGNVIWYYPHKNGGTNPWQYSSPLFVEGKLFIGNGGYGFLCLNPDTLQVLWQLNFNSYLFYQNGICTPAYDNGFIYLQTHDGHSFCLKALDGSVQWHVKQHLIHQDCPLLSDEYVYSLGNLSQVECRSRLDGSLVWTADTHVVEGGTNGSMALCGNILIVPGDTHRLWGLNRFTGQKVWSTLLGGNFAINSPIVVCGKVYISACLGDYYCLDGQTGQVEWDLHHGANGTFVGWAEADGQLFVGNSAGKMICFTSVTPGNPAACVCNLSATPVAAYSPSPMPTASGLINPNCPSTPTNTFTPTPTPTGTLSPTNTPTITFSPTVTYTPSPTFTPAPTSGPATITYNNTDAAVATALGVSVQIVQEARQLCLSPEVTYIIIVLTKHCGCHPRDIMILRLNMGWDDIALYYNIDWITFITEVNNLTKNLLPEGTTVNQIGRADANNPALIPVNFPPTPVPVGQALNLLPPVQGAACP